MKVLFALSVFASVGFCGETKVKFENLPPAVQASVKEHTRDATIIGITSEKEKGKTVYEVEAKVNGKGHDLTFDQSGALVETEDEIDLDSVPDAAKTAIQKRATGGTIVMVEKVTAGSSVSYEATIKTSKGKKIEYGVNADGSPHKED